MNAGLRVRLVCAALALVVTGGCGLAGAAEDDRAVAPVAATPSAGATPAEESPSAEVTDEPVIEETPSPKPSKTSKKPKPSKTSATPTEDPFNFELPPCAERDGKAVSRAKVKSALNAAATKTYWPGSAPKLKVPSDLIRAVAWHESGWQSNIVNCDGGYGLMQVMPDTESFINQRFEKSYDSHDYRQNAILGANYLAWLTKAFGDAYFKKNYSLSPSKCKSDTSLCLLNMVIAGYNMGRGSVDEGHANGELVNPEYVHLIRANMRECDCDRF
ncbi:lytic transglycosylase domain-containing protein [Actinoplanes sp. DH11]|uniref:lytic transglycosylase domain-containing protein n=1 Tax=Actinoplanes sp. DH11 TaxID=2857011 RepID=UPI001E34B2B8|nr:transglycosylase SLT domain-containing protein [Actinoplanes sp. DH11]